MRRVILRDCSIASKIFSSVSYSPKLIFCLIILKTDVNGNVNPMCNQNNIQYHHQSQTRENVFKLSRAFFDNQSIIARSHFHQINKFSNTHQMCLMLMCLY